MAKREIVVRYGEETTAFKFGRVSRDKLYGRKERVILDENGERCVSAYLTADGAALVPPGGTAHLYVDEEFDTVERSDLKAVTPDGDPIEAFPSTLGVAQELTPVRPERLLDHVISTVYELTSEELGSALSAALADGEIFETVYNYREGYDPDALFVLTNDEGTFALVGRPSRFEFIEREPPPQADATPDEDADADDLDDDLDFSMM